MIANQISSSRSAMRRSIARFPALRQWDKVYDMDKVMSRAKPCPLNRGRGGNGFVTINSGENAAKRLQHVR